MHSRVNEDIAWAGIKVITELRVTFGQHGDIGNTSNVLDCSILGGMCGTKTVPSNEQWTSLPSQCHVADSEVRQTGDACLGGDDGDLSHIKMGSLWVSFKHLGQRQMPDGLTLTGDEVDIILETEALLLSELDDGVCCKFS